MLNRMLFLYHGMALVTVHHGQLLSAVDAQHLANAAVDGMHWRACIQLLPSGRWLPVIAFANL